MILKSVASYGYAEFRSSQDKMVILMMMMMMTFHNFAGYGFIFAFKQPDVTYVISSFF